MFRSVIVTIFWEEYVKNTVEITEDIRTNTILKQIYNHNGHWQLKL